MAGKGKVERPQLVGAVEAQSKLNTILRGFFEVLSEGLNPRAAIRLTMGAGKTKRFHKEKFIKTLFSSDTGDTLVGYQMKCTHGPHPLYPLYILGL